MHLGKLLFSFEGRINRSAWWITQIFLWVFSWLTFWAWHQFGLHDAIFSALLTLFFFVVRLTVNVQRLHDRGKSGWWLLAFEIPVIGWIWGFIELGCLAGHSEENEHGKPPV